MELAPGAGDGCSTRDGAGLRRRLAAAPGLNLSVTRHGRYRDASGHGGDRDLRVSTHFGLHDEVAHTALDDDARVVGHRPLDYEIAPDTNTINLDLRFAHHRALHPDVSLVKSVCGVGAGAKRGVRALSFKKPEAREVRVFVRHCITRERVKIAI